MGERGELIFLNLLHMRDIHTNFQLPSSKTVTLLEMGAILPLKTLPLGGGDGVNFSKSISYERHT